MEVDYIIVGLGLAGSNLAKLMLDKSQKLYLVDDFKGHPSSPVAAGIINPITGKKFVKSWNYDNLIEFALPYYRNLEKQFGSQFLRETSILRFLSTPKEENDWAIRTIDDKYQNFLGDSEDQNLYSPHFNPVLSVGHVNPAYQLNIPDFLSNMHKYFRSEALIDEEMFQSENLEINKDYIKYKDVTAKKIIFCEGYRAIYNPLFNNLPFTPVKGELLIVNMPKLNFALMLKHKIFLIPLGGDLYWVGATYDWNMDKIETTDSKKQELLEKLRNLTDLDFEVVEHKIGVRPSIKDRRPVLGAHFEYANCYIFNGMGTKGSSMSPYYANQLTSHLLESTEIDSEVCIDRFK